MTEQATLRDGTRVAVQICTPALIAAHGAQLKEELRLGFEKLSRHSRRLRFISPPEHLSASQLAYLADVDNDNRVVWFARDLGSAGHPGIGLARYVRLDQEPDVAEFAITVLDDYQNKGLGTLLLRKLLTSAEQHGIRLLRGYTLPDNRAMLHLARKFNALVFTEGESLRRVEIDTAPVSAG